MTKRHFAQIASTLADVRPLGTQPIAWCNWIATCRAFAERLAGEYPRFDRKRFLDACGVVAL